MHLWHSKAKAGRHLDLDLVAAIPVAGASEEGGDQNEEGELGHGHGGGCLLAFATTICY